MIGEREFVDFNEFFVSNDCYDDISQGSSSYLQQGLEIQKLREQNEQLKLSLKKIRLSTKEVLDIYKNERQLKEAALRDLSSLTAQISELQSKCDELEKLNANNQFSFKEKLDELELINQSHVDCRKELAEDYIEVLKDTTLFYNYEIKRERNKVINKTTKFLQEIIGESFIKPHFITRRSVKKDKLTPASKRSRKDKEPVDAKRRKVEIWEMKSISQAASPASFHDDGLDLSEADSSFSYNTFSIGNETSYSLLNKKSTNSKSMQTLTNCKCNFEVDDTVLVSIGVNTEDIDETLPSVPLLDDFNFGDDIVASSTINEELPNESVEKTVSDQSTSNDIEIPVLVNQCSSNDEPINSSSTTTTEKSTQFSQPIKSTCDQSTSYECTSIDKSTSTIHSVTHRGTLTPAIQTKNFAMQYPELSFDKIIEEMEFDIPGVISPIADMETISEETQTELSNVNRELIYVDLNEVRKSSSNEEQSFIVLGQTIFNLFLNRLRESNKSINDDARTREKIWPFLRQQLLNRFDELTFDEYFNSSFTSESDVNEDMHVMLFEDVKEMKVKSKLCIQEVKSMEIENSIMIPEIEFTSVDNNHEEFDDLALSSSQSSIESDEGSKKRNEIDLCNDLMLSSSQSSIESQENKKESNENCIESQNNQELQDDITNDDKISTEKENSDHIASENHEHDTAEAFDTLSQSSLENQEKAITLTSTQNSLSVSPSIIDTNDLNISDESEVDEDIKEIEEILATIKCLGSEPLMLVSPIPHHEDLVWSALFEKEDECEDTPVDDCHVLDGYDIENEPIEIPLEFCYSPDEPPYFAFARKLPYQPQTIPLENSLCRINTSFKLSNILEYNNGIRRSIVTWQQRHTIKSKGKDMKLCKIRKAIKTYLDSEWTDESVDVCINQLKNRHNALLLDAIFETVEDHKMNKEINAEFTPPSPPLPRYQQKLILLINSLAQYNQSLPHLLVADLEMKLFKCENLSVDLDYLRNITYYYTSLIDLFFEGDTTMVFYFIVKCLYFYGCKSIPMIFVLIKAFPNALPKKSLLIKNQNTTVDWDSMTGLEMAKVRIDYELIDSLDLCVMYLLTNNKMYMYQAKKNPEIRIIYEHELFNYVPKYYGFGLNFTTIEKLIDILIKRVESGELKNLSFSLILLGKRMSIKFTKDTLLKGKLFPLLRKYVAEATNDLDQLSIDRICFLIEVISTILKPLNEEKEKSFKEIFPTIINVLGRFDNQQIQECCIKAILRLQRFVENHKEIYEMIKHHYEKQNSISESLRHAVVTFVHRKNEIYFKN